MTAKELARRCENIARMYKTVYMWGCIGSPVTNGAIAGRASQYPAWYTDAKQAELKALVGKDYWGFDCVNLIKAVLWGWTGDHSQTYGGAKYASNGVPDVSANGAIKLCRGVTQDFTGYIPVGAALWCEGHIGIYIGDGLGVECTPIWKNGVQITAVGNIGAKSGYNTRRWTSWGMLPWVEYEDMEGDELTQEQFNKMFVVGMNYWLEQQMEKPAEPYALESCEKAVWSGYFADGDGDNLLDYPQSYVKRMELSAVLDRIGLFDINIRELYAALSRMGLIE